MTNGKLAAVFAIALLATLPKMVYAANSPTAKPNILLIYSDDHGWADLGVQGVDEDIRTPHLDQLARDGVRFARGYVTAPQCVPSRAGLLTGRYQQKFGVEDNNRGPLPLAERTIAERLKVAGYVTGMAGKWHLEIGGEKRGKANRLQREHLPHGQGFDEYWCGANRTYYASHALSGEAFADAPRMVTDNRFRVEAQTEAALSFLDRRGASAEQPWFLYLAWYTPHVPLESPEPWFSQTPRHLPPERRQALAMMAVMDHGLGRIRARLREMGEEKDTLIVFIGDNGAPLKEGAWNGSLNRPLVGEKGMLTDGGVRVPFLAAWPGTIPAGQTYSHPACSLDVAATAVALAGEPREGLDGVNLLPFVSGQQPSAPHDMLFWRWRSQAAVLEFPWKLILVGDQRRYLFDVTHPAGETKNLIEGNPEIATRLAGQLQSWCGGLQPPGLPESNNEQDNRFFAAHVDKTLDATTKRRPAQIPATSGSVQGWLCRNGALRVKDGALVIAPDANAAPNVRPFITNSSLDLPGPVTATLRVRAKTGGASTITWRTKTASFAPEQTAAFDWPASADWRELQVELPEKSWILHIRIHPPKMPSGVEIQSIELRDRSGQARSWQFTGVQP